MMYGTINLYNGHIHLLMPLTGKDMAEVKKEFCITGQPQFWVDTETAKGPSVEVWPHPADGYRIVKIELLPV